MLSSQGDQAYDATINQEVMIMAVPLWFVGDSPMHAEISNTSNPTRTLTPRRMCLLSALSLADKRTPRYIQQFLRVISVGVQVSDVRNTTYFNFQVDQIWPQTSVTARCWNETIGNTRLLWQMSRQPNMFQKVVGIGKDFGIKDGTNQAFIGCLKDCHRQNHNDSQAPRQLAEKWDQTYGDKLFALFLRLRGLSMPLSLLFWKSVTCLAEVSSQKN